MDCDGHTYPHCYADLDTDDDDELEHDDEIEPEDSPRRPSRRRDAAAVWKVEPTMTIDEWRDREHFDAATQTYDGNGKVFRLELRPTTRTEH